MTVAADPKVCRIVRADSRTKLFDALCSPAEAYHVDVQGLEPVVVHRRLWVEGIVMVRTSPLVAPPYSCYLILCIDQPYGPCYIEVPWMDMPSGDLRGCRIIYCSEEFINEHLFVNLTE